MNIILLQRYEVLWIHNFDQIYTLYQVSHGHLLWANGKRLEWLNQFSPMNGFENRLNRWLYHLQSKGGNYRGIQSFPADLDPMHCLLV